MAGLARVGGALLFTTPMAVGARADLGIFRSTDEASSWSTGELLVAGPAGYSCLTSMDDQRAALIYENGDNEFAGKISFDVVN